VVTTPIPEVLTYLVTARRSQPAWELQLGLTHPQYLVMLALWEKAPMSVKAIGEALTLDSPTLSPLLKRLEASQLITRSRSRVDERQLVVDLTA
jgi:DNA-binding MarR family transcriptional regulator